MKTVLTTKSDAEHQTLVLPDHVLSFNRDTKTVHLHNGQDPGGRALGGQVTLKGPPEVTAGKTITYQITNYSDFVKYGLSVSGGSVVQNNETITFTAPETPGTVTLSISSNGVDRNIEIKIKTAGLKGIFTQLSSGATARAWHSSSAINGKLYIYGGYTLNVLNDLWCYDPASDSWQQLTSGPGARRLHTAVTIDGKMYVFGGRSDNGSLNDLWSYNPQTDSWTQLSSGATGRYSHTAVAINNKMYVFGGQDGANNYLNDLWVYDPQMDQWQQLSSGATSRVFHVAATVDNAMYIIGGSDTEGALSDIWRYDTIKDQWSQLTSCPFSITKAGRQAATISNEIYIFAGLQDGTASNNLLAYSIKNDDWKNIGMGGREIFYLSTSVIDNKMYVFGGYESGVGKLRQLWQIS